MEMTRDSHVTYDSTLRLLTNWIIYVPLLRLREDRYNENEHSNASHAMTLRKSIHLTYSNIRERQQLNSRHAVSSVHAPM